MRAGARNKRITYLIPLHTPDPASGENITTYTDGPSDWAEVQWEYGSLYEAAKQLNSEVKGVMRVPWRRNVKADWRIRLGTRTIAIISIANVRERNQELQITVKEALD
jgi:SPP1 family predicted phage head-tail adaptor